MIVHNKKLYNEAVKVSEEYLGPAGERFIRRQIQTHFNIEPENLKPQHIPELVDWVRLTFSMLTNDAQHVTSFSERLLQLAKSQHHSLKDNSLKLPSHETR